MKAIILDNIDETEIAELRANVQLNLYGEDRGEYTNCSLKPMPKRLLILGHYQDNKLLNSEELAYAKGRNDCIDEILWRK